MNKNDLSERDIITQFIMPSLVKSGWNIETQIREEVYFTDGRIFVKETRLPVVKENLQILYLS